MNYLLLVILYALPRKNFYKILGKFIPKFKGKDLLSEIFFGTDGIRRITNTELTPELAYKVKLKLVLMFCLNGKSPTILIGRAT